MYSCPSILYCMLFSSCVWGSVLLALQYLANVPVHIDERVSVSAMRMVKVLQHIHHAIGAQLALHRLQLAQPSIPELHAQRQHSEPHKEKHTIQTI